MPIKRDILATPFTKNSVPMWLCPSCSFGILELVKETLKSFETAESLKAHHHDEWDPEWTEYRFVCLLKCNNQHCGDIVSVCGKSSIRSISITYKGQEEYENYYHPEFFYPSPILFTIPEKCHNDIKDQISKAFAAFWCDNASCGNRIRAAVEKLLDNRKIPKTTINKKRKRVHLPLHARIEKFKNQYSELGENLLAIKWIGNSGSHSDTLTKEDLFDALDILEHVLQELYVQPRKRINRLTKEINKKEGPLSKKRVRQIKVEDFVDQ